jgi:uncharacterized protein YjbI with pentapeptide repeats
MQYIIYLFHICKMQWNMNMHLVHRSRNRVPVRRRETRSAVQYQPNNSVAMVGRTALHRPVQQRAGFEAVALNYHDSDGTRLEGAAFDYRDTDGTRIEGVTFDYRDGDGRHFEGVTFEYQDSDGVRVQRTAITHSDRTLHM